MVRAARFRSIIAGVALLAAAEASQLDAQIARIQPQAGFSLPTRISLKDGTIHVRQKIGFIVGARLTLTFNDRFDVVTGVSYVPGYATVHGAGKRIEVATSSHVLSGSTGARYWLLPPINALSWEIHTGAGVVFGGMPAYEDLFERSTVTGVLGTMLRYQIGRIVSLQMRVQQRLYRLRFGSQDSGKPGHPLQFTFALGLPFLENAR